MRDRNHLSMGLLVLAVGCGGHIAADSAGNPSGPSDASAPTVSSGGGPSNGPRQPGGQVPESRPGSNGGDASSSTSIPDPASSKSGDGDDSASGMGPSNSDSTGSVVSPFRSCTPGGAGRTDCGPGGSGSEDCCASLEVPGGTFDRNCATSTCTQMPDQVSVSSLRVDKYEITVGRFRQFVSAASSGWVPPPGSGKHAQLNGGLGLVNNQDTTGVSYEPGWDSSWNANLATTAAGWNANLSCNAFATWSASPGASENRPINCVTWFEVYAFCIWDGGFLPSDAEWNYTASGGSEQRYFPWSVPAGNQNIDCSYANYGGGGDGLAGYCSPGGTNSVGTESPKGDGKWGHSDLGGNVWEWVLDDSTGTRGCADCANLSTDAGAARVNRGGGLGAGFSLEVSSTNESPPTDCSIEQGARCARVP